jgi:hypothetical protein
VLCTTQGAFFSQVSPDEGNISICEFGDSQISDDFPNVPDTFGDWRAPMFFEYDLQSGQLIDRTPYNDALRNRSIGLRSAGSHNGVVFYGGGLFGGGIALFAFDANTKAYIGSRRFAGYQTIRKWLVVNNQLYTGVGSRTGGRILRWTGSRSNPWRFTEVGRVAGVARELTEYVSANGQRRIATTANGVYLSPAIQGSGLTASQAGSWQRIWSPDQYEPDLVTRSTYGGGGIAFLNGWLYFATMHIPGNAADKHQTCGGLPSNQCLGQPQNFQEQIALYNGTSRATSVWRIKNAESSNRVIQLLYGESQLPAYNQATRSFPLVNNAGGFTPLLGGSGFDWQYNNYAWVMEVIDNRLFVGTMDYSTLSNPASSSAGADLWRIDGTTSDTPVAAVAETTTAFGEFLYTYRPYGFRTLIKSDDGTRLFAGMATGVNLEVVGDGNGWQLLALDHTP